MTYCMSDIHGEYDMFMRLMERIGYSDGDRLIVCGDIIDKGPDSVRLAKEIFSMPGASCIMGNHEYTFFKQYKAMTASDDTDYDRVLDRLREYFPRDGRLLDWETVDCLLALPLYYAEERFLCVHAGIPIDEWGRVTDPSEADAETLVYDRRFKDPTLLPADSPCVFFGHTPTTYMSPIPRLLTYRRPDTERGSRSIADYVKVQLDTGAFMTGVMGCFRVEDCSITYSYR